SKVIEESLNDYDFTDWKRGVSFYHEYTAISNTKISFENYYEIYHWNIQKIEKKDDAYKLIINPIDYPDFNQKVVNVLNQINQNGVEIILKPDGDYLSFYLSDGKTLVFTFIKTNEETKNEFEKFLNTGKYDETKVTWPRHADGTSDYDDEIKPPMVKLSDDSSFNSDKGDKGIINTITTSQTLSVTENLKLRSGEATTTEVLTVMAAGTNVKILELGHSETIDGITSNWVKVELLAGAIDRDGKEIKAGTVGWCYGGYLEEKKQNDEKQAVKKDVKKKKKK
ncbi:MAG: SH3 domain-containing protein, partial [Treponema sp.]|nr:SH3 domain-containing protein [Treponema sp.]